ncbi:MAG TPA: DUF1667 domain-containing protein [Spirochaetales bacterium]|nr:DUF1667 domain-containing protein [Spirochaetales bacterium]HRY55239.1 DUF1667 domain-containing protein [Spirochaetia bacterium]HRZ63958.1 DUF1667 domain-containing protein [Spirochaetia bacterium]
MGETKSFVCVLCPRGCALEVDIGAPGPAPVRGNACPRGAEYGRLEAIDPRRSLTTTVATAFPGRPRLPVKSSGGIPLARLVEAARGLDSVLVDRPLRRGEVVAANLLGLGIDIVATDDLAAEELGDAMHGAGRAGEGA